MDTILNIFLNYSLHCYYLCIIQHDDIFYKINAPNVYKVNLPNSKLNNTNSSDPLS